MRGDGNGRPTVFISYSHRDEAWKDRLRSHLDVLATIGELTIWDDRAIDGGADWYDEIRAAMEQAALAVCIISKDFLSSKFVHAEEIPFLLERREEAGMVLLPVLMHPCPWDRVRWLRGIQMLPRDGKSVSEDHPGREESVLAEIAGHVAELLDERGAPAAPEPSPPPAPRLRPGLVARLLGRLREKLRDVSEVHGSHPPLVTTAPEAGDLTALVIEALMKKSAPAPVEMPGVAVDIARLPVSGRELFGREADLDRLDAAWEEGRLNVIALVAWGGVGKTTLVNRWLESLAADRYRGAERVYAWSFYSQGTGARVGSADLFIAEALKWFGDPDPTQGSPWDKGERLAGLVRSQRTLLVLDALEPLQSELDIERGKVKDPGLATLLQCLAEHNPGLCLVTTREPVADLDVFERSVYAHDLEQLSPQAGRALLRTAEVRGTDAELERATEDFGRGALALTLLGAWLRGLPGHGIARAAEIPDLDLPDSEGRHPRRVMAAFARRFGEGPEVEALRLLGLFDRPAESQAVAAVRRGEPLPGLTEHLSGLDEAAWLAVVDRLRDARLVAPRSAHRPAGLDAHPHVREHFGRDLERRFPKSWREANSRLYEHYRDTTEQFPDTLEGLTPLYQAVQHGCRAGRYQEALDEVLYGRIRRGREHFSTKKLGAFSADLSVLAGFFARPWSEPRSDLSGDYQGFVLNEAGFALRALGRLGEAATPMAVALERVLPLENWKQAAKAAFNLCELLGARGLLGEAEVVARRAVELAEQSGDWEVRMAGRTVVADTLMQADRGVEAAGLFEEAERMQRERQPENPLLYSLRGYQYSDMLLARGEAQAVSWRAAQTLEVATRNGWLLAIALDQLSLGRAAMALAQQHDPPDLADARVQLDNAVEGLRRSGQQDYLPLGLLARAALHRIARDRPAAERDLAEALKIATRSGLRLHEADAHLEYARLHLAFGEPEAARPHYETAARLVEACGYHRRDRELAELAASLAPGPPSPSGRGPG